jgi:hypothetical protein
MPQESDSRDTILLLLVPTGLIKIDQNQDYLHRYSGPEFGP